jgi:dipeptidyl aminopeptidase/acylaminoacyl peptidase
VAQESSFTLEQVLSAPFPDGLTAAPAGGKVAWVFNAGGARNVWVAEPAGHSGEYQSRSITIYAEDDGQEIAGLSWLPDSSAIVYARGGDFENGGDYPNPASSAATIDQGIWIVSLSGGAPRRLTEGHSPAVSPKGDRVAYIYKDQVWLVKISGGEKAEQIIHSKGKADSLRWSPDGSLLAFASPRGDHAFIGVYDLQRRSLRYLDPSVDRDLEPAWSPDGKQIAFIRLPANREAFLFGPKRTAQPWSIRVADVATGAGREVWKAEEGRGSAFREIPADNQILWGAGGRLVFPWERDGWTHLYSVSANGGKAEILTPGEFEVEHTSISPDRSLVLFASNQNDIDRRHIWKVGVAGGTPVAVTRGTGIEWAPVMTSDGHAIAVLRSDARRPARPGMVTGPGQLEDLAPQAIPANFPAASLVEPQQVILSASDGLRIHGQLFLPPGARAGEKHPALIFFHGGSRREMLLGWHYMQYYHNAYGMNQYLANHGYVVLAVNYRSGIGYGLDFREALNYGATGASEFNDVMGAGLYLRNRPDVDPARMGLWGGSYGGYLTALGLARASNLFAAGVDMHGVHDWNLEIHHFVPAYDPSADLNVSRLAFESSPLAAIKTWRSPVLLIQGDDDRNVPFSETVHLAEALRKQGVTFEQLVFPDEIHDFLMHKTWLAAYHASADFLDRKLGGQH